MNAKVKNATKDSSILMPIEDAWAAPDEWSDVAPAEDHTALHAELEDLTAAFLAKGGTIQHLDIGARCEDQATYNRAYAPETGKFTVEQYQQHTAETNKRIDAARLAKDTAVAKRIAELLPLKLGKCEFLHHCGCSEGVMQRVLEAQFANNPDAMMYKKVSWAERDRQLFEQYKSLQGSMCFTDIALNLKTKPDRLKKILATHGVRL